ncbi:EAL domain-containing protein [Clostridium sp.]|uniref:EAL domain-containing protein n=1 Tax=Clostridium sp. TaxID=1506 RepID=UPI001A3A93EE|nr:EAL domain-containing protein [Clostridium sp.]MBK5242785.1 EAL domain-containing protein [Clostridium sp.]
MKLFTKQSNGPMGNLNKILLVLFLSIAFNLITYISGGTQYAWLQLNFIVIIIAAYYWKIKGSLVVAILLGIIVGPFMPLNLSEGIMQKPENWIIRILIYLLVAFITGYIFHDNNEINKRLKQKDLISTFTRLYNTNKLFPELNKMIKNDKRFCLIFFKIVNLKGISKYVNYNIVNRIIHEGINHIKTNFEGNELYSSNFNEYVLVLKEYDERNITQIMSKYIESVSDSIEIDDYSFKLIIKVGIAFNNGGRDDAIEIYNKVRIAADQGGIYESGVYTYDTSFDSTMKLSYEISGSLQDAINKNEFYLVYQPIINLKDNTISEAEALLRWDRGEREPAGPQLFIPIAERIGLIKQITKWVIENDFIQKSKWKKNGLEIVTTINVTKSEIEDDSFREWVGKIIKENGIDRSSIV